MPLSIIKNLGLIFSSLRGWIFAITILIPPILAAITSIMEKLPWSSIILITVDLLAAMTIFMYFLMLSIDKAMGYVGKRREFLAVANKLQELVDVNHTILRLEDITGIWAGDQAPNIWHYNPKLRRLKSAARASKIRIHDRAGEKVNQKTKVYVEDVIKLFRSGNI